MTPRELPKYVLPWLRWMGMKGEESGAGKITIPVVDSGAKAG